MFWSGLGVVTSCFVVCVSVSQILDFDICDIILLWAFVWEPGPGWEELDLDSSAWIVDGRSSLTWFCLRPLCTAVIFLTVQFFWYFVSTRLSTPATGWCQPQQSSSSFRTFSWKLKQGQTYHPNQGHAYQHPNQGQVVTVERFIPMDLSVFSFKFDSWALFSVFPWRAVGPRA